MQAPTSNRKLPPPQKTADGRLVCRHKECKSGMYQDRATYAAKGVYKHERLISAHTCPQDCALCQMHKLEEDDRNPHPDHPGAPVDPPGAHVNPSTCCSHYPQCPVFYALMPPFVLHLSAQEEDWVKKALEETLKSVTENEVRINSPNQNSFSPLDRQLGFLISSESPGSAINTKNLHWKAIYRDQGRVSFRSKEHSERLEEVKTAVHAMVDAENIWSSDEWENRWQKIRRILRIRDSSELDQSPTLQALLDWKDDVRISDQHWAATAHLFKLDETRSIHYISALRDKRNTEAGYKTSPGGRGVVNSLDEYIKTALKELAPPNTKVCVKLALDGARITANQQFECGTVQILWDQLSVDHTKSPSNAHQWLLYIGPEAYEDLREEMGPEVDFISSFLDEDEETKKYTIETPEGSRVYEVSVALVLDMKALCVIMGMYNCYQHGSKYRCPWCLVTKDEIGDFTKEDWDFRDMKKTAKAGAELDEANYAESTRKRKAGTAEYPGLLRSPLLRVSFKSIIPDVLHIFMAISKLLLKCLLQTIDSLDTIEEKERVGKIMIDRLEGREENPKIHLKLYSSRNEKETLSFTEKLKKSRLNRTSYIGIMTHYKHILDSFSVAGLSNGYIDSLTKIWELWITLYQQVEDPAKEWDAESARIWSIQAKEFGQIFTSVYTKSKVTTYLHILIYHLPYFLECYGCLDFFGNYAIEAKHQFNKRSRRIAVGAFSKRAESSVCMQIVTRDVRMNSPESKKRKQANSPVKRPRKTKKASKHSTPWSQRLGL
ncbi:hypothetical protein PROFUN_15508 [Planoprotostelium fungivorum]|uniref:Uncharacterized protein n=1 Tax=Planoprotostelium fungivorum TaxID=1890364 RepID=A0A2P6MSR3_9EUKA|nr:hypothetical protein PROFUN_15508 [Planoprotostelium fungivorum]